MDVAIYDKLAKRYDLATKIVSFGIEEIWRYIFIKTIKKYIKDGVLLDIASATGENAKKLCFKEMILIDPSEEMNKIAKEKLKVCNNSEILILKESAESFKLDKKVDLITAFMAVRNFDNLQKGMNNLKSHLNEGGYIAIVEMVNSKSLIAKMIFWYMNNIVPFIAGFLLGMKSEYKLLGKSISSLSEDDILSNLEGLKIVKKHKLIFPIATLIIAKKDDR